MKKLLKKKKGFTLIELLICLFIIGLMMLLIIPNIENQRKEAQKTSNAAIVKVIENQKELYKIEKKTDTEPSLQQLQEGKYITQEQADAYTKATEKPQTNPK